MKRTLAFLFLLGVLLGAALPVHADEAVSLKPATEVRGAAIRLSDVFDGLPEGKDLDIAIAPAPGKSVTYDVRVLTQLTEQYQLGWKAQSLADHCLLTRASSRITPEMIRAALIEKIRAANPSDAEKVELSFDSRFVGVTLPPDSSLDFDVNDFAYDSKSNRFRASIIATPAAGAPIKQAVTGRVTINREIPVLSRHLAAGATISDKDIVWETVAAERLPTDALTDSKDIVGQELRRALGEGESFRARDLIPPRLVTRGSLVMLKVETPAMQITTQGRALQDGAKGDTVRVTNVQSNRVIEGTVEATGIVNVGIAHKKGVNVAANTAL